MLLILQSLASLLTFSFPFVFPELSASDDSSLSDGLLLEEGESGLGPSKSEFLLQEGAVAGLAEEDYGQE